MIKNSEQTSNRRNFSNLMSIRLHKPYSKKTKTKTYLIDVYPSSQSKCENTKIVELSNTRKNTGSSEIKIFVFWT